MRKKYTDISLVIGIAINIALALFFVYLYYYSIPRPADLITYPVVKVPEIVNLTVKNSIVNLQKVPDLPLNIDPNDLGKKNPYNF